MVAAAAVEHRDCAARRDEVEVSVAAVDSVSTHRWYGGDVVQAASSI